MLRHLYLRSLDPDSQGLLTRIAHWVRPASVVLDIGCGPGILGRYLVERLAARLMA
ncbi:MAG: hypothetical protein IPL59_15865 [Candidatus Competibacteraceae bacterium]|nr:hypothetical protein [Candidatus Competibacteraceae bacterium]